MQALSLKGGPIVESKWDVPAATAEQVDYMLEHLEKVLGDIEFLDPKAPRQVMTRFRRLFQRSQLDQQEVGMLRGMLDCH